VVVVVVVVKKARGLPCQANSGKRQSKQLEINARSMEELEIERDEFGQEWVEGVRRRRATGVLFAGFERGTDWSGAEWRKDERGVMDAGKREQGWRQGLRAWGHTEEKYPAMCVSFVSSCTVQYYWLVTEKRERERCKIEEEQEEEEEEGEEEGKKEGSPSVQKPERRSAAPQQQQQQQRRQQQQQQPRS